MPGTTRPPAPGVPLRRPSRPVVAPRYHVRAKDLRTRQEFEALANLLPVEMTQCWDHLAHTPDLVISGGRSHRLRGDHLRHIWQYKPTLGFNYRIWYTVDALLRR